jgi:hypothetical protein
MPLSVCARRMWLMAALYNMPAWTCGKHQCCVSQDEMH